MVRQNQRYARLTKNIVTLMFYHTLVAGIRVSAAVPDLGRVFAQWWGASVKTTVNSEQMKTTLR